MAAIEPRLFGWEDVEARSDLERFYLVRAMWNAVFAGVVFQHPGIESLLRELRRNPALLKACGFEVLPVQKRPPLRVVKGEDSAVQVEREAAEEAHWAVPEAWHMSRFPR